MTDKYIDEELEEEFDEDIDERIACPFCDSEDDCPHLLAVIDRSFLEVNGGYAFDRFGEFETAIEQAFRGRLAAGASADVEWADGDLSHLWGYALENDPTLEYVYLDGDVFYGMVIELFQTAGADEFESSSGDMPGYTSAITVCYAENCASVFEKALADLQKRLVT